MFKTVKRPNPEQSRSVAPQTRTPTDLLTVSEAARLLRVSRRTVERLVGRGALPFYELPVRGGLRFDRTGLNEWLARRHRSSLGGH